MTLDLILSLLRHSLGRDDKMKKQNVNDKKENLELNAHSIP